MDETNRSFEAVTEPDKSMADVAEEEEEEHEDDDDEEDDDHEYDDDDDEEEFDGVGDQTSQLSELERLAAPIRTESSSRVGSQSETLAVTSSHQLLADVPVSYSMLVRPLGSAEFKDQIGVSHQQALLNVTARAAQAQVHNQPQSPGCLTSSSELSPTSVTQPMSSARGPPPLEHISPLVVDVNSARRREVEQQNSSDSRIISAAPVVKTPSADGYNWRKYGQKQVKSPQGSRSYYRCTYSECVAKKIECSDHSNRVVEIICKGLHNHDPPRKSHSTRESRLALSATHDVKAHPGRAFTDSDPSISSKEPREEVLALPAAEPESKQEVSSAPNGNAEVDIKEEHADEPEPKRRLKKSNSASPGSVFKAGKKQKFVVHAAGDVGISGDGYRWRKYGQKMVKGNPHPRNYYRCTSAGCPVRKHIERAVDSTTAVIITYKGVHDHDMPVPKKRHGPPSAPLVAAAAPASMSNLQFKKTEALQNQLSATQWSVDTEGELKSAALETGEEKAMESARTLLSIGFEIKPC